VKDKLKSNMLCSESFEGKTLSLGGGENGIWKKYSIFQEQCSMSLDKILSVLRYLLDLSVRRNLAEGILLSGGLDTSIIASIASKYTSLKAFTVAFKEAPAPDIGYASIVARNLGLKHFVYYFGERELYESIHQTIDILKTFDPMEVRNSAAIYIALRRAREEGVSTVLTGDGADEIFAGYSFFFNLDKIRLKLELERIQEAMFFSSIPLARNLSMEARLPYLDPDLRSFAAEIPPEYKVREERGAIWGKWILRKAYEETLPEEIVWRIKTPIEFGTGTTILPELFNRKISDEEFEKKKKEYLERDRVTIQNKEQLFYYEIYRNIIGVPRPPKEGRACPYCNSAIGERATYCRTCGASIQEGIK
jgi:asparagine synthase (glutamine-hydrolysing)